MQKPTANICPNCNKGHVSSFYEAKDVPVNSCMMFRNHEEAVSFPRGNVVLGFCDNCGFITNIAFDSSRLDYSKLAPEEQGFSGTFNTFVQRLTSHLIQNYDLHNKQILEIGCGRGDFLAMICEKGNNYGTGIDPSSVIGGVKSNVIDRLNFIRDYYSERYANYHGDLICCRHTLEHIPNTFEFISTIRKAIGDAKTAVFFEVPDVTRILREVAFWDIYYEHCSYFSLGSLARLFRLCNFEVTNLIKNYFDQYLLIEAKPVNLKSERILSIEESPADTARDIADFTKRCEEKLGFWRDHLQKIQTDQKRAVVWGSGSKCVAFMTTLGVKDEIEYIVDINPHRHGKFIPGVGKQIVAPEFLKAYKPDTVIVMNPVYCNEIKQMLESLNVEAELIPCS